MNLKETIISSFFFHLILFFAIAAVSSYTTALSGSFQTVTVDLSMNATDLPQTEDDSAVEPAPDSSPPSDEEVSMSEPGAESPDEKPDVIPEPEKKTEPAEPPKIEKAEPPPTQPGGFTSMEAYYQFIMLHKKVFGQKAGVKVNELLGEALKVNTRQFFGGIGIVDLTFGADGKLSGVTVNSESPDLKAFLEEISWAGIPPPSQYSLGYARVQIEFRVLEGYMNFNINAF